jgi:hypothetical protein
LVIKKAKVYLKKRPIAWVWWTLHGGSCTQKILCSQIGSVQPFASWFSLS